jgi:hypothetical protein
MDFHPSNLKVLLLTVATGALVLSAAAQQAGPPLIFSSPQTGDSQSVAPSLAPDRAQSLTLPGTLQAPVQLFNYGAPNDLPLPTARAVSPQQQRMQKLLEERNNWILMTPDEILGKTTAEKMLQPPERDALGREKNPTQLERYLQRQDNLRNGVTNSWQNDRANSPWTFPRDRDNANLLDSRREDTAARNLTQFMNSQQNGNDSGNANGNYGWGVFSQPLPQTTTKPDLEKLAAMERFRQLLSPSSAQNESSPDRDFSATPKAALDPFITQPAFVPNPAGASFTPLSSGIARPIGLTPLPGAVTSFSLPVATPAWKPQRAPWLLQGPQPFVMPQQKGF